VNQRQLGTRQGERCLSASPGPPLQLAFRDAAHMPWLAPLPISSGQYWRVTNRTRDRSCMGQVRALVPLRLASTNGSP
jgi:hypothetical protein